jgi:glycine dehydrogenase subunit 1
VFREFAVNVDAPTEDVIERCLREGINPGYPLGSHFPEYEHGLLVAITELRTREQIDRLAHVLGDALAAAASGHSQHGARA